MLQNGNPIGKPKLQSIVSFGSRLILPDLEGEKTVLLHLSRNAPQCRVQRGIILIVCHKLNHKFKRSCKRFFCTFWHPCAQFVSIFHRSNPGLSPKLKKHWFFNCIFSRDCSNRNNSLLELLEHKCLLFDMDWGVEAVHFKQKPGPPIIPVIIPVLRLKIYQPKPKLHLNPDVQNTSVKSQVQEHMFKLFCSH